MSHNVNATYMYMQPKVFFSNHFFMVDFTRTRIGKYRGSIPFHLMYKTSKSQLRLQRYCYFNDLASDHQSLSLQKHERFCSSLAQEIQDSNRSDKCIFPYYSAIKALLITSPLLVYSLYPTYVGDTQEVTEGSSLLLTVSYILAQKSCLAQ